MTPFLEQLLLHFTTKRALGAFLFCYVVGYPLVIPLCNFYRGSVSMVGVLDAS